MNAAEIRDAAFEPNEKLVSGLGDVELGDGRWERSPEPEDEKGRRLTNLSRDLERRLMAETPCCRCS